MPLPSLSLRTPSAARHRIGFAAGALLTLWLACAQPAVAQLPPAIEADRLLLEASTEMEKEKDVSWTQVLTALEAAEATGARMPANFHYHLGHALNAVGDHERGQKRLERYLSAQGNKAKYYKEALQALSSSRKELAGDKRRGVWERFEWADQANGELRDRQTGLVWQFCNSWLGNWNGKRCDGRTAQLTWERTPEYAHSAASRSGKPWRMPTRAELREVAPYFPRTGVFSWTSEEMNADKAYAVSEFDAKKKALGESDDPVVRDFYKSQAMGVRLVR